MDMIFLKLLNMSIAAGWLISAVLLLRLFLKKAPKRIVCVLWGIIAFRLICPISLKAPFSLIPSAETFDPQVVRYAQNPTVSTGVLFLNRALNPVISRTFSPVPGASANPLYIWMSAAGTVWAAGAILLLGYGVFRCLQLCVRVRERVPIRSILQNTQEGISIPEKLWLCDAVTSPFILGLLNPRIVLPSGICLDDLRYVAAHEEAHLKRRDHWWKILGYVLLAVYCFHPLVWAAYILFCRDLELACDEQVIRSFDPDERKAYANALVSCSMRQKMVLACPLAFGETDVKKRVNNILHYKKPGFGISAASAAVCILLAACFLTDPPISVFNGSRTGNDSEFIMAFQKLHSTDSQDLTLEAGDILSAAITVDDGRMAVTICKGDEIIYENNEIISSIAFHLEIEENGIYTVKVTGEHARGSVSFLRNALTSGRLSPSSLHVFSWYT